MVIIGVSAGVSYGQFQRLTAQVASSPTATQADASATATPAAQTAAFVAASTTTWTAAKPSGVAQPALVKPVALVQPEPPLQQFTATTAEPATRMAPQLGAGIAALVDPILETATPEDLQELALASPAPVVTSVARKQPRATAAPKKLGVATTAPGTIRRFRNFEGTTQETRNAPSRDPDGTFEQVFPQREVARAPRANRPSVRASTRAAQRQARFQRTWSTGVYR